MSKERFWLNKIPILTASGINFYLILRIKEDSEKRKNWMMLYRFSNIVILQV